MNYRNFGVTGFRVSELGFGCGSVGGLFVRGSSDEMIEAVERALDIGINYFLSVNERFMTHSVKYPWLHLQIHARV